MFKKFTRTVGQYLFMDNTSEKIFSSMPDIYYKKEFHDVSWDLKTIAVVCRPPKFKAEAVSDPEKECYIESIPFLCLKDVYMTFLLEIWEDFDDDLLFDAICLLTD